MNGLSRIGLATWTACLLGSLAPSGISAAGKRWPTLDAVSPKGGGEKDAALLVTIENYAFAPKVAGATRNGEAWLTYLVKSRKTPAENTVWLRDGQAAKETIEEAADRVAKLVQPGGTLWFVFVGHGAASKDKHALLVGVDAQRTEQSLRSRSVQRASFLARLGASKAKQVVALLDACHSGSTPTGEFLAPGTQGWEITQEIPQARSIVLTAAQGSEVAGALPLDGTRPAFSYLVLGGLRGWADEDGNGEVTARELHDYTSKVLRTLATDRQQTPTLEAADAGAVIASSLGEAKPDLVALQTGDAAARDSGSSDRPWYARKRVWGGILLGVGAAAGAVGALYLSPPDCPGCSAARRDERASVQAPLTYGLLGVGGAALVTGLVLVLLGDSPAQRPKAGWKLDLGPLGLALTRSF